MDVYGKIAERLKAIAKKGKISETLILPAQVKSVSGTTCTVVIDDLEVTDVRLRAVINGEAEQLLIKPKIDSYVLIADLSAGSFTDFAVISYSEIESISVITDGKISIKNKNYSLADAFSDLIAAIGKLTVTTGVGPSGTPINIAEFQTIQQKLDKLLE